IWNMASTVFRTLRPSICPEAERGQSGEGRARRLKRSSFPQIVAVGLRDDLPAIVKFHRHQIVGEVTRRQLAAHLDEGGGMVRAVDRHDEILARLAFGLGGGPLADAI